MKQAIARPSGAGQTVARLWARMPRPLKHIYYRLGTRPGRWVVMRVFPNREEVAIASGGLVRGMRLKLNPRTEHAWLVGTYEPELDGCLPALVAPGMVVYDIGANVGFFVLAFARLVGPTGQVVAFEPSPRPLARLRENVALNSLDNVQVVASALSDVEGTVVFSLGPSDSQGRLGDLRAERADDVRIEVPCLTVDGYVRRGGLPPNVVKIDVEHAEGRVLRGMSETLRKHRPRLVIEMHGPEAQAEAYRELQTAGYRLARLPDWSRVQSLSDIVPLGKYLALPETDPRWK